MREIIKIYVQNAGEMVSLNPHCSLPLCYLLISSVTNYAHWFFLFVCFTCLPYRELKLQVSEFFWTNRVLLEARFRVCRFLERLLKP